MPAYNWQTDPFGYMGSNSPNFIAAGQPEYLRGELENEKARVAAGGAPTYNPILAGQFGNIPAYDLNKGQSYSDFLAREAARTQAGANSGPYTNNPTLNWNFLNQNSNAIPTSNFRLPTYQDPKGVVYPIRAGTTTLPEWATNVTPNWQQLIGGGQAQWGNPGAPTYQPGQNIFAAPPAATTTAPRQNVGMGGGTFGTSRAGASSSLSGAMGQQAPAGFGYQTAYATSGTPARAATPVVLPPVEVSATYPDYWSRTWEPDTMGDLDKFYQEGGQLEPGMINPYETQGPDQMVQSIQERAQRRIDNASKVGTVSEQDKNRIFQEEASIAARTEAAKNAPGRTIDVTPGGTQAASVNQIPWIIPISGLSPTEAIIATILLNSMGRGGGGSTGGATGGASTGSTTGGSTTGSTSTPGDTTTPGGTAIIGLGTGSKSTGQTSTPTDYDPNRSGPGAGIYPGGVSGQPSEGKKDSGAVTPFDPNVSGPGAGIYEGGVSGNRPWTVLPGPDWSSTPPGRVIESSGTKPDGGTVVTGGGGGTTGGTTGGSTGGGTATPATVYNPVTRDTTASLRNLLGEGTTTAAALQQILPSIYQLYGQGARSLAQSDLERMAGITGGNIFGAQNANLTQLAAQQTAAANRALREGNLADAQALAMQAESLKRQANPELYDALRQQQQVSTGQVTTDLERLQQAQARQLSPEDVRNAQQAAREAYSARGLVMGPGAIGAEILNRENLARQREQEARANLQTSMQNLGQTIGYRTANVFDPLGATLGQQYGMQTGNVGLNQALFNQAAGISGGAYGYGYAQNLANPFSPYAQDVYGTNVNALNAAAIANANRAAALEAAKMGQTGVYANALGSFLGSSTGQSTVDALLRALGIK